MAETIVLTPEQLFFLGECMQAKFIDYAYIASMHELQRNYARIRNRCISELAQAGLVRERLSGEISVRPLPGALLKHVFFGETETTLEVYTPSESEIATVWRYHWLDGNATQVLQKGHLLEVSSDGAESLEKLVSQLTQTQDAPEAISEFRKDSITRIIMAKKAVVGKGYADIVLFEQNGGLYAANAEAAPTGISGQRAKQLLLSVLKGE